jgi:lantibiotic modifying enzyme
MDPKDPESIITHLYSGSAGVVLFFLEAYHATKNPVYLQEAREGADYLIATIPDSLVTPGQLSLYTGVAGIGFTLYETFKVMKEPVYREAAMKCVEMIHQAAREVGAGSEWDEVTDIIRGSAGVGLFLLYAAEEMNHPASRRLAAQAGRRLLELGIPEEGGLKWRMDPQFPRLMPNFSHGTAGICYFLATLYYYTGDKDFLEGALAGARYLLQITNEQGLIFHHEPEGEDLFYLGWCHGPVGTARLYYKLWEVTRDQEWLDAMHRAAKGVMESGIPEKPAPGFWNTVGQCCGTAGVAEFFLDLHRVTGKQAYLDFSRRMTADLLARGTEVGEGMKWIQAEHRVRPELLIAQTGYMQGAAGIGLWLLHLDAFEQGREKAITLPDSPF